MCFKAVFSFRYFIVSFGLQEIIRTALRNSFVFLIMQSRQVRNSAREARHISEPVVGGLGYLKIVVVESFDRFTDNTI